MANLLGFNIGTNYKGILNIGAVVNTPLDTTLRSVTDGMGVSSPLQLSTVEASVLGNLSVGAAVNATGFGQRIRVIGQGDASVGVYRNQASSSAAKFEFMKSRGTYDSPLVVNNLDEIGSLGYFAFNGTSYSNSARVYARAVSSTGTGVEGELLTTLWNNTGGNLNMLRLTLTGLGIGNALDYTPSARLHVRGDGTNPIARFEDGTGAQVAGIGNNGFITGIRFATLNGQSRLESGAIIHSGGNGGYFTFGQQSANAGFIFSNSSGWSLTSGTAYDIDFQNITFGAASGNANYRKLNLAYTINNTGAVTGTATGIFLNATETALNGMTHNLLDLQVGGNSVFRVTRTGNINTEQVIGYSNSSRTINFTGSSNGIDYQAFGGHTFNVFTGSVYSLALRISGNTANPLLQFSGTTNLFPALKRNAAALEVRLADDSGFANLAAANINLSGALEVGANNLINWAGRTTMSSPVDGNLLLRNSAFNNFFLIQLGGTTTAFPAIKRFGQSVEIRLADDSAFASLSCGGLVSSGNLVIGTTTASARIHVRGDGTNPVARFENSSGTLSNLFLDSGMLQFGQFGSFVNIYPAVANDLNTAAINGSAMVFRTNVGTNSASSYSYFFRSTNGASTIQSLAGTNGFINMTGAGFSAAAGSANYRHLDIGYSINNSGAQTGVATGIFLNATETALNGMGHNLVDLQVGGVSVFRVSRSGQTSVAGYSIDAARLRFNANNLNSNLGYIRGESDGVFSLTNAAENGFGRLQFGGTTNTFPAIKRVGAAIDFRLADDTNYCSVALNALTAFAAVDAKSTLQVGGGSLNASAILQADSTTRGFLPPRQNTTQRNNVASPAKGLIVFDTDINKLFVYSGSAWEEITSV